jgi:Ca-activated chloride channel family protein
VLPAVVVFFWYAARHKRRAVERFGDLKLMRRLSDSVNRRAQMIKKIVTLAVLAALITALARPQFGTRVETVTREGQDIVVAIDVSASMLAEDIVPNRLEKAKHEVASLIGRLRGDRIGLVVFAGEAFVQSPLTVDYGAAMMFLNAIGPDIIPVPGTDLGLALDVSLDAFDETERQHRALVIITDGEDHEEEIGPRHRSG